KTQSDKAEATARRIEQSVDDFERQISFATRASATTVQQRAADYQLLLQQAPQIERLILLDADGKEQLRAPRGEKAVERSGVDYSADRRFRDARRFRDEQGQQVWLSPVYFDGPDPILSIVMQHSGRNAGSTVAEINLKSLSRLVDSAQIGKE